MSPSVLVGHYCREVERKRASHTQNWPQVYFCRGVKVSLFFGVYEDTSTIDHQTKRLVQRPSNASGLGVKPMHGYAKLIIKPSIHRLGKYD